MSNYNHIRLTDRFIIERQTEEGNLLMTIDGHDLKEFTLEQQSSFTDEIKSEVIKNEASADALGADLYQHINVESNHYQELTIRINDLNTEVDRNRLSIDNNKALIDELYETTRIIGRYHFLEKNSNPSEIEPGEMGAKFVYNSTNGTTQKLYNITEFYFHIYDRLHVKNYPVPVDGGTGKTFDNLLVGDLIEISYSTESGNSLLARGSYIITGTELISDTYGKVTVEAVKTAGDEGQTEFPFSNNTFDPNLDPDDLESWRDYRIEVFPSIPTESFVDKSDYKGILKRALPIGMVMPWFGSTSTIPEGWMRCDGSSIPNNNQHTEIRKMFEKTPDLTGRALVGAGAKGVSTSANQTVNQSTSKPTKVPTTANAGGHTHTVTLTKNGAHSHTYGDKNKYGGGTTKTAYGAQQGSGHYDTSSSGGHTHTVTLSNEGQHNHTISGWDSYNRMYSHTCHFIMKVYHIE